MKITAAPANVQTSGVSENAKKPIIAAKGSRIKSSGITADASALLKERVNAIWAKVPEPATTQSQNNDIQLGHSHTNSAGIKDIGVNKMTIYATMRSGGSVAASILIDTIDIAIKIDDAINSR